MHVETVKLFSALVSGRNIQNVHFMLENADFFGLKYDLLLAATENTNLPKFYRRYLIDILREMFVDCEPNMKVKFRDFILLAQLPETKTDAKVVPVQEVNDRFFKYPHLRPPANHSQLKRALVGTLQSIGSFQTCNYDGNLLLASCLTTLNLLLQYGL